MHVLVMLAACSIALSTRRTLGRMNRSELSMESRVKPRRGRLEILVVAKLMTVCREWPSKSRIKKWVENWIIEYLTRIDVGGRCGERLVRLNSGGQAGPSVLLAKPTRC